jgi:hypothetical protein
MEAQFTSQDLVRRFLAVEDEVRRLRQTVATLRAQLEERPGAALAGATPQSLWVSTAELAHQYPKLEAAAVQWAANQASPRLKTYKPSGLITVYLFQFNLPYRKIQRSGVAVTEFRREEVVAFIASHFEADAP